MARELKRKRSSSPAAAPRAAEEDDYRDLADTDLADKDLADRIVIARIDDDKRFPCRVCAEKYSWLRFVGNSSTSTGTWCCSWCQESLWDAFASQRNLLWSDFWTEGVWEQFVTFVQEHVSVREPWHVARR